MTETTHTAFNAWLKYYAEALKSAAAPKKFVKVGRFFCCPCCYLPTLKSRQDFNICILCDWEDDGQDDHNADKVLGGPNRDYSLTEARQNFQQYFTMYRPADAYDFSRTTEKPNPGSKSAYDLAKIKKEIIERYNLLMSIDEPVEKKAIWKEIEVLQKKLQ
jgi:hypothetical protein